MKEDAGKVFEGETGAALAVLKKLMPLDYQNSNTPTPMCDHMVWHNGRAYLLEEKETHSTSFSFKRITGAERESFEAFHRAGCEGWVLIKWIGINTSRVFACTWADWLELEDGFGFSQFAKRQNRGSGSFPLLPDEQRPGVFVELFRQKRRDFQGGSLGNEWDLSPLFGEIPPPSPGASLAAQTECPKCLSAKIKQSSKAGNFECQLCKHKWKAGAI